MDLGDWLRSLGLARYEAAFRDNDIDEEVLPSLTAEDLKDLGIHRSQIGEGLAQAAADRSRCQQSRK